MMGNKWILLGYNHNNEHYIMFIPHTFFSSGYAADEITHCIRPQDVVKRRAVIILRRLVFTSS